MNDSLFVRRLECFGNLRRDPKAFAEGNRSAGHSLREIVTIDQFDDESGDAVALFRVRRSPQCADDSAPRAPALPAGSGRGARGVFAYVGEQDLDGDVAAKRRVARTVDSAHAAFAQQ